MNAWSLVVSTRLHAPIFWKTAGRTRPTAKTLHRKSLYWLATRLQPFQQYRCYEACVKAPHWHRSMLQMLLQADGAAGQRRLMPRVLDALVFPYCSSSQRLLGFRPLADCHHSEPIECAPAALSDSPGENPGTSDLTLFVVRWILLQLSEAATASRKVGAANKAPQS